MSNYRELFERLAKCNLPAGITIRDSILSDDFLILEPDNFVFDCTRASECRAALMLIVDALEATGEWWVDRCTGGTLWIAWGLKSNHQRIEGEDPDEVTALAECLIAVMGVAE